MENCVNVINALKNSNKLRHWDKPPEDYGPNNPEDSDYNRNGLTDVGDFSKIDFSRQCSLTSETETNEERQEKSEDEAPADCIQESFHRSTADTNELEEPYRPDSLEIARKAYEQYRNNILLETLSLEKKYKQIIYRKAQEKQEAYIQFLNQIHARHEEEMEKELIMQQEQLRQEEHQLRQQEDEALMAVQKCKNEYTNQVSIHSSQLLEAVESARRQEAEQANIVQSLVAQLQTANVEFVAKLDIMYQLIKDLDVSETINMPVVAQLNQTRAQVEGVINGSHQRQPTRMQIDETHKVLQQGLTIVVSIIQKLEAKKLERSNLEAERIRQEDEKTKAKAAELEMEQQQQALRQQEMIENQQKLEERCEVVPESSTKDRLMELKQKVNHLLEANDKLSKDQQWDVRRKATIANQINKENHSINRDKLQKLLNEFRERKAEPDVLASFKNSVMNNIVKQVAILDALGASAYSWLLVELATFHPDMWDLFQYYLFKICSTLMPGSQIYEESLKFAEKPDVYYNQIGKYCTMYGFVLARLSKKQGSPIKAAAIGWEVLANILSQEPVSGVTGELLLKFIVSGGYMLQETYGKQFVKLMEFTTKCYLPQIRENTEEGGKTV
ncbi:Nucleoporin GLE1 [Chionoecetes opilio]|uniref:mRNA export factor GLE1 n=1 Tax=Chionoecetes opilio TaxID=41210 RepID=A0A8J4YES4_CHIOP|nr:Nucleoporin GLE1 [Chionoecetes opilio]